MMFLEKWGLYKQNKRKALRKWKQIQKLEKYADTAILN